MTTVKTRIKPTWTTEKLQEVTSHTLINNYIVVTKIFEKLTPELRQEFRTMMSGMKVNYYRSLNVKTPMDLANAMAEFDANIFGSVVAISGDQNNVTIEFETCGCWNLIQNHSCFTPAMGESRHECYKTTIDSIIRELGFKGVVEMTGKTPVIHISK